jgi:hypothetical protein
MFNVSISPSFRGFSAAIRHFSRARRPPFTGRPKFTRKTRQKQAAEQFLKAALNYSHIRKDRFYIKVNTAAAGGAEIALDIRAALVYNCPVAE